MRSITLSIIFLFLGTISYGQFKVSGDVQDINDKLYGATLVVLDKVDSTMISFGITDEEGEFELYDIPQGDYVIQISYTGYTEQYRNISCKNDKKIELETIILVQSNEVIRTVSINAERIPMGIKGDTINYNAAAFKVSQGASVEDLLKKLPGIEVARDGSIKAQGEEVKSILVDGKEFFSGDPTMATKNLDAEAVEKVQVFDKKSEDAEFTGIDDGNEEKSINLELKEGFKNGGFGKVAFDGEPLRITSKNKDRYLAKINYNRFGPKIKTSLLFNTNNINKQAFSFNEYINLMGGFSNVFSSGGGGFSNNGFFDFSGKQSPGVSAQTSLGTNFNYDPSKKLSITANYLFAGKENKLDKTSISQHFTSLKSFKTLDSLHAINHSLNQKISTHLKYNFSPEKRFTLKVQGLNISTKSNSIRNTDYKNNNESVNLINTKLNTSGRRLSTKVDSDFKQKFSKKGRNWKTKIVYSLTQQKEDLHLINQWGLIGEEVKNNQEQDYISLQQNLDWNTSYTEPLQKGLYFTSTYQYSTSKETPLRNFYDIPEIDKVKNDLLSGKFKLLWNTHQLNLNLRRNKNKLKINGKISFKRTNLAAHDLELISKKPKTNYYLLPGFYIEKTFKKSKMLEFNYATNISRPSLNQLITIPNNLNPNAITIGNSDLNSEYLHHISINYSSIDAFNMSNLFSSIQVTYSPNKIVSSRNIKEDFTAEITPINSPSYYSITSHSSHTSPIRALKLKYSISQIVNFTEYSTHVNHQTNNICNGNISWDLRIENRKKTISDLAIGFRYDLGLYKNSLSEIQNQTYTEYSLYTDGIIDVYKGLQFRYVYDLKTFEASTIRNKNVFHILDISITKAIYKEKITIKASAHDLFNQNRGIQRNGGLNQFKEERYNVLGRYYLIGLSYKFR